MEEDAVDNRPTDALLAELARLRQDAMLLDWIEQHIFESHWFGTIGEPPRWTISPSVRHTVAHLAGPTLRSALLAELARLRAEKEPK